ncbi:hypothetical protein ZIOFF_053725 [Zingiber officinale]|uniref:Uncharacterized protein n=1 Tax=Zingiber officinale TaxID=94328 RepID=A0A8J5KQH4_ZINOF|nr:hypothetical protein ZIOFF_053725 [Zingiber officinale]
MNTDSKAAEKSEYTVIPTSTPSATSASSPSPAFLSPSTTYLIADLGVTLLGSLWKNLILVEGKRIELHPSPLPHPSVFLEP